jgi:hypothetical protein
MMDAVRCGPMVKDEDIVAHLQTSSDLNCGSIASMIQTILNVIGNCKTFNMFPFLGVQNLQSL